MWSNNVYYTPRTQGLGGIGPEESGAASAVLRTATSGSEGERPVKRRDAQRRAGPHRARRFERGREEESRPSTTPMETAVATAVSRRCTATARGKRKRNSEDRSDKRNTRPFLVAEICAGISGGMVGAVRAGENWPHQAVEPLYAADTCDKNGQVSKAVLDCQILTGDATSDVIRRRITKSPTPKLVTSRLVAKATNASTSTPATEPTSRPRQATNDSG
jgi:hypothetical protein